MKQVFALNYVHVHRRMLLFATVASRSLEDIMFVEVTDVALSCVLFCVTVFRNEIRSFLVLCIKRVVYVNISPRL